MITFEEIKDKIDELDITKPDLIIYPRRGGLFLAMLVAYKYNIKNFIGIDISNYDENNVKLNSVKVWNKLSDTDKEKLVKARQILIVDDIIDSGATIETIIDLFSSELDVTYEVLTIIDKTLNQIGGTPPMSDYILLPEKDNNSWIDFPWDNWKNKNENN